ncbi:substrate-binding periplasmic protein, partial [Psittacicella hinzii]
DERKKRVNFSTPYVGAKPGVYIVNNSSPTKNISDLKVVGVQQGTTLASYLMTLKGIEIKYYPSFDTAMLDLKGGRVEAVFESLDVAAKYLDDKSQKVQVLDEPIFDNIIGQGTGIAFRKSDKELLAKVNKALAKAKETGFLNELAQKYGVRIDYGK